MRTGGSVVWSLVLLLALALVGSSVVVCAGEEIDESHVVVLTEDNFDDTISEEGKIFLVEFYAPWCGHCQQLAPEYARAAAELAEVTDKVVLAKVDATENGNLAQQHDVTGYPTLKIYRDGATYDYEGGRSAQDIVSVMKVHADPSWQPPKDRVIVLTAENFDETVNKEPIMLVEFYAPWCGHCKRLAPEYEKAARDLWEVSPRIPLAKVDATQERELADRFGVTGYPTLFVFRNGKHYKYTGPRQRYGIVDEMRELAQPPASKLETVFDIDSIIDGDAPVVIGFFDSDDSPGLEVFQDAASIDRKLFKYAYATSDAIRKAYNVQSAEKVVVFQPTKFHSKLENPSIARDVGDDATELNAWIKAHGFPVVGHRTNNNVDISKYEHARPLVLLYFEVDFSSDLRDETNFWREKLVKLALDKYADKVNKDLFFAVASEEEFSHELGDFKRKGADEEFTAAILAKDNVKYLMEDEFDMDNLEAFIDDFLAGNLKPYLKSEPIPKSNKGPVVKVVADAFDAIVNDESKDVLIEFFAPWCGHCKQLKPVYKKLAKKLSKVDDVVIAAMDATTNDVPPPYKATGYPTIYFAPRGDKSNPIPFDGDRDVDGFLSFLRKHSSAKIPKFKKKKKAAKKAEEVEPKEQAPKDEL